MSWRFVPAMYSRATLAIAVSSPSVNAEIAITLAMSHGFPRPAAERASPIPAPLGERCQPRLSECQEPRPPQRLPASALSADMDPAKRSSAISMLLA